MCLWFLPSFGWVHQIRGKLTFCVTCGPCRKSTYSRRNRSSTHEIGVFPNPNTRLSSIHATDIAYFQQPQARETNPYWGKDILMGPGPTKRKRRVITEADYFAPLDNSPSLNLSALGTTNPSCSTETPGRWDSASTYGYERSPTNRLLLTPDPDCGRPQRTMEETIYLPQLWDTRLWEIAARSPFRPTETKEIDHPFGLINWTTPSASQSPLSKQQTRHICGLFPRIRYRKRTNIYHAHNNQSLLVSEQPNITNSTIVAPTKSDHNCATGSSVGLSGLAISHPYMPGCNTSVLSNQSSTVWKQDLQLIETKFHLARRAWSSGMSPWLRQPKVRFGDQIPPLRYLRHQMKSRPVSNRMPEDAATFTPGVSSPIHFDYINGFFIISGHSASPSRETSSSRRVHDLPLHPPVVPNLQIMAQDRRDLLTWITAPPPSPSFMSGKRFLHQGFLPKVCVPVWFSPPLLNSDLPPPDLLRFRVKRSKSQPTLPMTPACSGSNLSLEFHSSSLSLPSSYPSKLDPYFSSHFANPTTLWMHPNSFTMTYRREGPNKHSFDSLSPGLVPAPLCIGSGKSRKPSIPDRPTNTRAEVLPSNSMSLRMARGRLTTISSCTEPDAASTDIPSPLSSEEASPTAMCGIKTTNLNLYKKESPRVKVTNDANLISPAPSPEDESQGQASQWRPPAANSTYHNEGSIRDDAKKVKDQYPQSSSKVGLATVPELSSSGENELVQHQRSESHSPKSTPLPIPGDLPLPETRTAEITTKQQSIRVPEAKEQPLGLDTQTAIHTSDRNPGLTAKLGFPTQRASLANLCDWPWQLHDELFQETRNFRSTKQNTNTQGETASELPAENLFLPSDIQSSPSPRARACLVSDRVSDSKDESISSFHDCQGDYQTEPMSTISDNLSIDDTKDNNPNIIGTVMCLKAGRNTRGRNAWDIPPSEFNFTVPVDANGHASKMVRRNTACLIQPFLPSKLDDDRSRGNSCASYFDVAAQEELVSKDGNNISVKQRHPQKDVTTLANLTGTHNEDSDSSDKRNSSTEAVVGSQQFQQTGDLLGKVDIIATKNAQRDLPAQGWNKNYQENGEGWPWGSQRGKLSIPQSTPPTQTCFPRSNTPPVPHITPKTHSAIPTEPTKGSPKASTLGRAQASQQRIPSIGWRRSSNHSLNADDIRTQIMGATPSVDEQTGESSGTVPHPLSEIFKPPGQSSGGGGESSRSVAQEPRRLSGSRAVTVIDSSPTSSSIKSSPLVVYSCPVSSTGGEYNYNSAFGSPVNVTPILESVPRRDDSFRGRMRKASLSFFKSPKRRAEIDHSPINQREMQDIFYSDENSPPPSIPSRSSRRDNKNPTINTSTIPVTPTSTWKTNNFRSASMSSPSTASTLRSPLTPSSLGTATPRRASVWEKAASKLGSISEKLRTPRDHSGILDEHEQPITPAHTHVKSRSPTTRSSRFPLVNGENNGPGDAATANVGCDHGNTQRSLSTPGTPGTPSRKTVFSSLFSFSSSKSANHPTQQTSSSSNNRNQSNKDNTVPLGRFNSNHTTTSTANPMSCYSQPDLSIPSSGNTEIPPVPTIPAFFLSPTSSSGPTTSKGRSESHSQAGTTSGHPLSTSLPRYNSFSGFSSHAASKPAVLSGIKTKSNFGSFSASRSPSGARTGGPPPSSSSSSRYRGLVPGPSSSKSQRNKPPRPKDDRSELNSEETKEFSRRVPPQSTTIAIPDPIPKKLPKMQQVDQ